MDKLGDIKIFWDSMAEQFTDYEIPTPYNNEFMKQLYLHEIIDRDGEALDIGCGGGKYSLGLAPYFKHIIGTDISTKMIEGADRKKAEKNIDNIEFRCKSWQELDIEKEGWIKKFDFVFAHMTPAVGDAGSFEKMRLASKKWCAVTKSVYRKSDIAEGVNIICGNVVKGYGEHELNDLLTILWKDGIVAETFYEKETWTNTADADKLADSYIKRMTVKKELSDKEKEEIYGFINSKAKNGIVTETTDVVLCTIYWKESEEEKK